MADDGKTTCNRRAFVFPEGCPLPSVAVKEAVKSLEKFPDLSKYCKLPSVPKHSFSVLTTVQSMIPQIPWVVPAQCLTVQVGDPRPSNPDEEEERRRLVGRGSFQQVEDDCTLGQYRMDMSVPCPIPKSYPNQQTFVSAVTASTDNNPGKVVVTYNKPASCELPTISNIKVNVPCPVSVPFNPWDIPINMQWTDNTTNLKIVFTQPTKCELPVPTRGELKLKRPQTGASGSFCSCATTGIRIDWASSTVTLTQVCHRIVVSNGTVTTIEQSDTCASSTLVHYVATAECTPASDQ